MCMHVYVWLNQQEFKMHTKQRPETENQVSKHMLSRCVIK